jgi:hypothetical protein
MADGPRDTLDYATPGHERPASPWLGALWTVLGLTMIGAAAVAAFILWVVYLQRPSAV